MVAYLDPDTPFPSVLQALTEPNGLLAAGADLSPERLINAYSQGIFPWYSEGEPILWWSPDPRMVFDIQTFRPSRSLCRFIKNQPQLRVTLNQNFERVITECAKPTDNRESTWIDDDIKKAYLKLHHQGYAHSLEVWQNEHLVGGIYGIANHSVFCGESMFSRISNGSKTALACLIAYLKPHHFSLIDCQVENPHLVSLGAVSLSRNDYLEILKAPLQAGLSDKIWQRKSLCLANLVTR
ncbi:MAG: leucyl/phenylalanyl-tRNA--protein transferase [Enterobacterales bacterium]|nr:leucyl/phenylalanyl-tRNA--protein transferase [Enterobacterales bacterium]